MKSLFISIFFLLISKNLSAQADGMLWRVSGNGLQKASYLFGTIHLYCNHQNISKYEIQSAMDSSSVVAMELNLNDYNTFIAMMKSNMKSSGKSLKKMLKQDEYQLVDSVFLSLTGNSLESYDNKSPITVLSRMIISKEIVGCQGALPVDMTIAEMAKRGGKISLGLESFEFQDSLLNNIPDTMQMKWLLEFCRDIPKAKSEFKTMLEAYDAQKSSELYNILFKTSPEIAHFKDKLLVQRNISWSKFLNNNMKQKTYFMAVGAGHLGGDDGLISLLRKAGYAVIPIHIK